MNKSYGPLHSKTRIFQILLKISVSRKQPLVKITNNVDSSPVYQRQQYNSCSVFWMTRTFDVGLDLLHGMKVMKIRQQQSLSQVYHH